MSPNDVRTSAGRARQSLRQFSWPGVFSWLLALLLGMVAWLAAAPGANLSAGMALGQALLFAALSLALERALSASRLPWRWSCRFAFLGSGCLALARGIALAAAGAGAAQPLADAAQPLADAAQPLAIAWSGAWLGGLLATALNGGLWEDNSPPSQRVALEVQRVHRLVIGSPGGLPFAKRLFDVTLAGLGLFLSAPLWLLFILLIWLEDPGPILFVKNSVGKGGVNFRQFKFRTMVREAEHQTGPVLSREGDDRVLWIGAFLRRTALDELPQLLNILRGEMSFVGPRPQRTVLVQGYLEAMPEYAERHRVPPGLAGLAQVAGDYYLTPRQKLRFDRLYIRSASLGFDLKLLLLAFMIAFWFRWQKGWNGRLPRRLLRFPAGYRKGRP